MDETRQEKPTRRVETWTPDPRYSEFFGSRGYKILGPAGNRGGESSTFLAEKDGQKYVLKVYKPEIKPDREVFWELRQQQEAAQRYFPRLYEHGQVSGTRQYYEVWEYISGGSLRDLIRKLSDFTERKEVFKEVIRQVSEALHLLHERDIIHRDLKPSNILIRRRNPLEMVLIDFGISRKLAPDATQHYTTHFKGTRMYSAPEESSPGFGKEVDWWHLGIIGYEILLGKNPFGGMSDMVILNKLSTEDIAIPSEVEEPERRLLLGLLTRDPKKRWGYAAIQKWLHGEKDIPVYREDAPASPQTSRKRTYTLDDWRREGFTEHSYKLWESLGLSPSEARSFEEEGFGVENARPWVKEGFCNGKRCSRFIKQGITDPREALFYDSFGLSTSQAALLRKEGISPDLLIPFGEEPDLIYTLVDHIQHVIQRVETELKRINKGIRNPIIEEPRGIIEAVRMGFSKEETFHIIYRIIFYGEKGTFITLRDYAETIKALMKAGFSRLKALYWVHGGFRDPEEVRRLEEAGFSDPEEAWKWEQAGWDPEEAGPWPWYKAGFRDPEEAWKWKSYGYSDPKEAWRRARGYW